MGRKILFVWGQIARDMGISRGTVYKAKASM